MLLHLPAVGFLALAAPGGQGEQPSLFIQLVPFLLIFAVFYFLLIAPARKKQKRHAEMLSQLKRGDRVLTTGGMYGTVVGLDDDVVQVRISDGVKVEMARHAIADLAGGKGE